MHTAISGRLESISSISSAMRRLSAGSAEAAKRYRISDLIPKSWDASHEKGQFRNFMAERHLWIQAWSDQGERILVRVESVDKVERSTLAVDCTEPDFRTFETALYQVVHGTTTNEPLRMVQQVQGQEDFEAWRLIVRRYGQRDTSDRSSAYASLVSNISERDRAKDVEQFDDILRNFIKETNKYEGRFGKIREEEMLLAVKRLMPESLLNCRFRGTTVPYEELLIALENIIIDKVTRHSVSKVKKFYTSASREIGMAAGADGEEAFEEGCG